MSEFLRDLRFGGRLPEKSPMFTVRYDVPSLEPVAITAALALIAVVAVRIDPASALRVE